MVISEHIFIRVFRRVSWRGFLPTLLAAVCLSFVMIGCGRKGPPVPPESFFPGPVLGLTAAGATDGVALNWLAPVRTQNGQALKNLVSFSVRRRLTDSEDDFTELASVEAYPAADAKASANTTPGGGEAYSFVDKSAELGNTYDYLVVPINSDQDEGLPGAVVRGSRG